MTQSLHLLLTTLRQRRLIPYILPYIPKHHLDRFDAELNWRYVPAAARAPAAMEAAAVEAAAAGATTTMILLFRCVLASL